MRARVAIVVVALFAIVPAHASASRILVTCGPNLCQVDPATKKVKRLTRDGRSGKKAKAYTAASISRSGRRMAFWFGRDLYASRATARGRRKLDTQGLPGQAFVRPDGRSVAFIESRFLPNICPIGVFVCGSSYNPTLVLQDLRAKESKGVATRTVSAGWLGGRLMRDEDPSGPAPQRICVLRDNTDRACERPVAAHPTLELYSPVGSPDGRYVAATMVTPADADRIDLDGRIGLFRSSDAALVRVLTRGPSDTAPAFSPDGRSLAFNRGRDLYVTRVTAREARGRRIGRRLLDPTWSVR